MESIRPLLRTLIAFAATILIILTIKFPLFEAGSRGFSIELIHRDSPKSPLYNPFLSSSCRVLTAFKRSFARANHLFSVESLNKSPLTDIILWDGDYLMKLSIGTPPVADTGNDLTWIQCKPCVKCYKQNAPIFTPGTSSTYKAVSSDSGLCKNSSVLGATFDNLKEICSYSVISGDGSYSHGDLATETITFYSTTREKVLIPGIVFGCGHKNGGLFDDVESGIVGLGGGKVSLISQLQSIVRGKFSYPLAPHSHGGSSRLNFRDNGVVSGEGAVSTPIFSGPQKTLYHLKLEGVSVGMKRLGFHSALTQPNDSKAASEEGSILIYSGTTLTYLPMDFYHKLLVEVKNQIKVGPVSGPYYDLCYSTEGDISFPDITVHFKGANLKLKPVNTFVTNETSMCLAFSDDLDYSIYGNMAQINFLVGYDLRKKVVSFKPVDCAKEEYA